MMYQRISKAATANCRTNRLYYHNTSSVSSSPPSQPKFPIHNHYQFQTELTPKIIVPSAQLNPHDQHSQQQHQIDIANALRPSYQSQTPLHLPHIVAKCDAFYFWRSLEYWRAAVEGNTLVDVEVGKSYNSGKRIPMGFGEYLNYLDVCIGKEEEEYQIHLTQQKNKIRHENQTEQQEFPNGQEVAYLAQNEIFPQVKNDVIIPHLCHESNLSYNVGEGKLYHTMLWMGPRNTVSPLHYDPLDNLLMQIVGWKRVLLFPPKNEDTRINSDYQSKNKTINPVNGALWHYAGSDGNQYNTSAVDIENPNYETHPDFQLAPTPYECLLGPGDVLFIPKKWWHHVRSLEWSVSVNAWWR